LAAAGLIYFFTDTDVYKKNSLSSQSHAERQFQVLAICFADGQFPQIMTERLLRSE
jgi:hypothetical protein